MRRLPFGLTAGVLAIALGSLVLTGCGGPTDDFDEPLPRAGRSQISAVANVAIEKLKPLAQGKYKYEGAIEGSVKWVGEEPDFDQMTKALQAGMLNDRDYCLTGKKGDIMVPIHDYETFQQGYRLGDNKGLGNVFVWIQPEPGWAFDVPDAQVPAVKEVRIHQPHCAFLPHCTVLFPSRYKDGDQVPTGQKLIIMNDARVGHNAKVAGGPLNGTRDQLLGAWDGKGATQDAVYELKPEKDAVAVSCGVHGWMRGYVRVFDHPYAAVTGVGAKLGDMKNPVWEDRKDPAFGSFQIKGAPIGAKVRLFAWHEALGHLKATGPNGKEITISPDPAKNRFDLEAGK
jgi:hypothetical protein